MAGSTKVRGNTARTLFSLEYSSCLKVIGWFDLTIAGNINLFTVAYAVDVLLIKLSFAFFTIELFQSVKWLLLLLVFFRRHSLLQVVEFLQFLFMFPVHPGSFNLVFVTLL